MKTQKKKPIRLQDCLVTKARTPDIVEEAEQILSAAGRDGSDDPRDAIDRALDRTTDVIDAGARVEGGRFPVLYAETRQLLATEYAEQKKIAATTVRVVKRTTELMRRGLEQAVADLMAQTDQYTDRGGRA